MARRKKKIKTSTIVKIVIISVVVMTAATIGIVYLKNMVTARFAASMKSYDSATVEVGSIGTTVKGDGYISDDGIKDYDIPDGVELKDILVDVGDSVTVGQKLATINTSSVLSAMYDTQKKIDEIDAKLDAASEESAASKLKSKVKGRVKGIYVKKGDDVVSAMAANNTLMIISMDGKMAVEIDAGSLKAGDKVNVKAGKEDYSGKVDSIDDNKAVILISDKEAAIDAEATVKSIDGKTLGSGKLYVHSPLTVVAYAGTVSKIYVDVNEKVDKGDTLIKLKDTSYTAGYDKLISERKDLTDDLSDLLKFHQDGAVLAQMAGTIKKAPKKEGEKSTSSSNSSSGSSISDMADMYGGMGYDISSYADMMPDTTTSDSEEEETKTFSICPDAKMTINVNVDETEILSLSIGQKASVTIDSLEKTVEGAISDIDKTGEAAGGVTSYTAEITIDKEEGMLSGMSASVVISVNEVTDALLVPAGAINNTGTTYFVYTSYDEATDTPSGMVEVEVGVTNDDKAQIISGVKEGDTIYYKMEGSLFDRMMARYEEREEDYERERHEEYDRNHGGEGHGPEHDHGGEEETSAAAD